MTAAETGGLHHLELWVPDLERAETTLGWLLGRLGWEVGESWPEGVSWRRGSTYVVLERGPDVRAGGYDRTRPGLNHLALHSGSRAATDLLVGEALAHGWVLMYADRHPHAGGPDHYAAYLEDADGLEVELVAAPED